MAESTSKLRSQVKALTNVNGSGGVDILADEKTFRSTYDIMSDIAGVWQNMSDIDQSALLELLAGKVRSNQVAALLSNFDQAEKAMKTSQNAEGTMDKVHRAWMDSVEARKAQFEAAQETLSMTVMPANTLKGLYQTGTSALGLLNTVIGGTGPLGFGAGVFGVANALRSGGGNIAAGLGNMLGFHRDTINGGITRGDIGFVNAYNEAFSELGDKQAAFARATANSNKAIDSYTMSLYSSTSGMIDARKVTSTFGSSLLSFAKNAAVGLATFGVMELAAWGLNKAWQAFDANVLHRSETLANNAATAYADYEQAQQKSVANTEAMTRTQAQLEELRGKENRTPAETREMVNLESQMHAMQLQQQLLDMQVQRTAQDTLSAWDEKYADRQNRQQDMSEFYEGLARDTLNAYIDELFEQSEAPGSSDAVWNQYQRALNAKRMFEQGGVSRDEFPDEESYREEADRYQSILNEATKAGYDVGARSVDQWYKTQSVVAGKERQSENDKLDKNISNLWGQIDAFSALTSRITSGNYPTEQLLEQYTTAKAAQDQIRNGLNSTAGAVQAIGDDAQQFENNWGMIQDAMASVMFQQAEDAQMALASYEGTGYHADAKKVADVGQAMRDYMATYQALQDGNVFEAINSILPKNDNSPLRSAVDHLAELSAAGKLTADSLKEMSETEGLQPAVDALSAVLALAGVSFKDFVSDLNTRTQEAEQNAKRQGGTAPAKVDVYGGRQASVAKALAAQDTGSKVWSASGYTGGMTEADYQSLVDLGDEAYLAAVEYAQGGLFFNKDAFDRIVRQKFEEQLNALQKDVVERTKDFNTALKKMFDGKNLMDSTGGKQGYSDFKAGMEDLISAGEDVFGYRRMAAQLGYAMGEYSNWLSNKGGPESDDMYNELVSAATLIEQTKETGRTGTREYAAALQFYSGQQGFMTKDLSNKDWSMLGLISGINSEDKNYAKHSLNTLQGIFQKAGILDENMRVARPDMTLGEMKTLMGAQGYNIGEGALLSAFKAFNAYIEDQNNKYDTSGMQNTLISDQLGNAQQAFTAAAKAYKDGNGTWEDVVKTAQAYLDAADKENFNTMMDADLIKDAASMAAGSGSDDEKKDLQSSTASLAESFDGLREAVGGATGLTQTFQQLQTAAQSVIDQVNGTGGESQGGEGSTGGSDTATGRIEAEVIKGRGAGGTPAFQIETGVLTTKDDQIITALNQAEAESQKKAAIAAGLAADAAEDSAENYKKYLAAMEAKDKSGQAAEWQSVDPSDSLNALLDSQEAMEAFGRVSGEARDQWLKYQSDAEKAIAEGDMSSFVQNMAALGQLISETNKVAAAQKEAAEKAAQEEQAKAEKLAAQQEKAYERMDNLMGSDYWDALQASSAEQQNAMRGYVDAMKEAAENGDWTEFNRNYAALNQMIRDTNEATAKAAAEAEQTAREEQAKADKLAAQQGKALGRLENVLGSDDYIDAWSDANQQQRDQMQDLADAMGDAIEKGNWQEFNSNFAALNQLIGDINTAAEQAKAEAQQQALNAQLAEESDYIKDTLNDTAVKQAETATQSAMDFMADLGTQADVDAAIVQEYVDAANALMDSNADLVNAAGQGSRLGDAYEKLAVATAGDDLNALIAGMAEFQGALTATKESQQEQAAGGVGGAATTQGASSGGKQQTEAELFAQRQADAYKHLEQITSGAGYQNAWFSGDHEFQNQSRALRDAIDQAIENGDWDSVYDGLTELGGLIRKTNEARETNEQAEYDEAKALSAAYEQKKKAKEAPQEQAELTDEIQSAAEELQDLGGTVSDSTTDAIVQLEDANKNNALITPELKQILKDGVQQMQAEIAKRKADAELAEAKEAADNVLGQIAQLAELTTDDAAAQEALAQATTELTKAYANGTAQDITKATEQARSTMATVDQNAKELAGALSAGQNLLDQTAGFFGDVSGTGLAFDNLGTAANELEAALGSKDLERIGNAIKNITPLLDDAQNTLKDYQNQQSARQAEAEEAAEQNAVEKAANDKRRQAQIDAANALINENADLIGAAGQGSNLGKAYEALTSAMENPETDFGTLQARIAEFTGEVSSYLQTVKDSFMTEGVKEDIKQDVDEDFAEKLHEAEQSALDLLNDLGTQKDVDAVVDKKRQEQQQAEQAELESQLALTQKDIEKHTEKALAREKALAEQREAEAEEALEQKAVEDAANTQRMAQRAAEANALINANEALLNTALGGDTPLDKAYKALNEAITGDSFENLNKAISNFEQALSDYKADLEQQQPQTQEQAQTQQQAAKAAEEAGDQKAVDEAANTQRKNAAKKQLAEANEAMQAFGDAVNTGDMQKALASAAAAISEGNWTQFAKSMEDFANAQQDAQDGMLAAQVAMEKEAQQAKETAKAAETQWESEEALYDRAGELSDQISDYIAQNGLDGNEGLWNLGKELENAYHQGSDNIEQLVQNAEDALSNVNSVDIDATGDVSVSGGGEVKTKDEAKAAGGHDEQEHQISDKGSGSGGGTRSNEQQDDWYTEPRPVNVTGVANETTTHGKAYGQWPVGPQYRDAIENAMANEVFKGYAEVLWSQFQMRASMSGDTQKAAYGSQWLSNMGVGEQAISNLSTGQLEYVWDNVLSDYNNWLKKQPLTTDQWKSGDTLITTDARATTTQEVGEYLNGLIAAGAKTAEELIEADRPENGGWGAISAAMDHATGIIENAGDAIIDLAKQPYARPEISTEGTSPAPTLSEAVAAVEAAFEPGTHALVNGNVDLKSRPVISAQKMLEEGWQDFADSVGDYATLFSSTFTNNGMTALATPIGANGTVYTPYDFENYIGGLMEQAGSVADLISMDSLANGGLGLVIAAMAGESDATIQAMNELGQSLSQSQAEMYGQPAAASGKQEVNVEAKNANVEVSGGNLGISSDLQARGQSVLADLQGSSYAAGARPSGEALSDTEMQAVNSAIGSLKEALSGDNTQALSNAMNTAQQIIQGNIATTPHVIEAPAAVSSSGGGGGGVAGTATLKAEVSMPTIPTPDVPAVQVPVEVETPEVPQPDAPSVTIPVSYGDPGGLSVPSPGGVVIPVSWGDPGPMPSFGSGKSGLSASVSIGSGVAVASGTEHSAAGSYLVDERGAELIEHVSQGTYELGTNGGARFTKLNAGDIVHTAKETRRILGRGGATSGKAFGGGIQATVTSSTVQQPIKLDLGPSIQVTVTPPSTNSNANTTVNNGAPLDYINQQIAKSQQEALKNAQSSGNGEASSNGFEDWLKGLIDWIPTFLNVLKKKTTEFVTAADDAIYYISQNKLIDDAINNITSEISANIEAVFRYRSFLKELAQRGALSDTMIAKIEDGTIDINSYDEDTVKAIQAYQQYYEKLVACQDALESLNSQMEALSAQKLDNIVTYFEQMNGLLRDQQKTFESLLDMKKQYGQELKVDDYTQSMNVLEQMLANARTEEETLLNELKDQLGVDGELVKAILAGGREVWDTISEHVKKNTYSIVDELKPAAEEAQKEADEKRKTQTTQSGKVYTSSSSKNVYISQNGTVIKVLGTGKTLKELQDESNAKAAKAAEAAADKTPRPDYDFSAVDIPVEPITDEEIVSLGEKLGLVMADGSEEALANFETIKSLLTTSWEHPLAIGSDTWYEYMSTLEELRESIYSTQTEIGEMNDEIANIPLTNLKTGYDYLNSIKSNLLDVNSLASARGTPRDPETFRSLISVGMKQIENLKEQNKLIEEQMGMLDPLSSKYQELRGTLNDNLNVIADIREDQEEWNDAIIDLQIDRLKKQNDTYKEQLRLMRALDDLEDARQRKLLVYHDEGGFRYEADEDALEDAQEAVNDAIYSGLISGLEKSKEDSNIYGRLGERLISGSSIVDSLGNTLVPVTDKLSGLNFEPYYQSIVAGAEQSGLLTSMLNSIDMAKLLEASIGGDVNIDISGMTLNEVNSVKELGDAIIDQLPGYLMQALYQKGA